MTDQYVPKLRKRFVEDVQIKGLHPKTRTVYLRAMRDFARYLSHSPETRARAVRIVLDNKGN